MSPSNWKEILHLGTAIVQIYSENTIFFKNDIDSCIGSFNLYFILNISFKNILYLQVRLRSFPKTKDKQLQTFALLSISNHSRHKVPFLGIVHNSFPWETKIMSLWFDIMTQLVQGKRWIMLEDYRRSNDFVCMPELQNVSKLGN